MSRWKLFYWKLASTIIISASSLMVAGLATGDGTIITVERAMRWMFWLSVISGTTKAVDSLFDQTFGSIKAAIELKNGNGHKPVDAAPGTATTTP